MFTISFCSDHVFRAKVEHGTIPISRRVFQLSLRLIGNPIRNGRENFRSVSPISFFEHGSAGDPDGHLPLSGQARYVAFLFTRLLTIVWVFVVGIQQWSGHDNVRQAHRASATNLVATNLCAVYFWMKWWRNWSASSVGFVG